MPTFCPPTDDIVSPVSLDRAEYERMPLANRLRAHGRRGTRGRNIFKLINGTYTENEPAHWTDASTGGGRNLYDTGNIGSQGNPDPNAAPINTLKTYYGGHCEDVTPAEATALAAAGYSANITYLTWSGATMQWNAETSSWVVV